MPSLDRTLIWLMGANGIAIASSLSRVVGWVEERNPTTILPVGLRNETQPTRLYYKIEIVPYVVGAIAPGILVLFALKYLL
ncbi:MAG: hypothetical protein F6J93_03185 [Oscillatoria sp. SIO1A7]|nr:hypothetical protein [Oscillatoria sp. SIO1A7]